MPDILVIKNTQISPMASSIQTLFRERMKIIDLKDIMNENLNLYNYILVFTTEELELSTILKEKITNYLKNEKTLICDLTFYISLRGGKTKKEPVKALYKDVDEKTFRYAEHIRLKKRFRICRDDLIENRPKIKIIKEKDWTKGFHIGDEIYWYGLFRPEEKYNVLKEDDLYIKKTDFGKCFWYNDEMNFKYYEKLWNDWEEKKEQYFYQNRETTG